MIGTCSKVSVKVLDCHTFVHFVSLEDGTFFMWRGSCYIKLTVSRGHQTFNVYKPQDKEWGVFGSHDTVLPYDADITLTVPEEGN